MDFLAMEDSAKVCDMMGLINEIHSNKSIILSFLAYYNAMDINLVMKY